MPLPKPTSTPDFAPGRHAAPLDAYDTSGLSRPKFAQLHGIDYQNIVGLLRPWYGHSEQKKTTTRSHLPPANPKRDWREGG